MLLCTVAPLTSGAVQAQSPAPVGVQRLSEASALRSVNTPLAGTRAASGPLGGDRFEHAVWGAAIGGVLGVVVGYYHGKHADAQCSSECGGGRIEVLVDPPLFGLFGSVIGAVVGYALPGGG